MASELDVAYVAQLARLQLTAQETELFQKQLGTSREWKRRRMRSRFSTFFVQMILAIGSLPPKP